MRRRLAALAAVLAAALVLTLAVPVGAQTAPVVTANLGRKLTYFNHFGNPALGRVLSTAQGQVLDTNGDGAADSLRGRGAMVEIRHVTRLAIYDTQLQRYIGGFQVAARNTVDLINGSPRAGLVRHTPAVRFCTTNTTATRIYRVVHRDGIRWTLTGLFSARTTYSLWFRARLLANDPACPAPPPPPPSSTTTSSTSTTSTTLPPAADLTITKTALEGGSPKSTFTVPDDDFTYRIRVANAGPAASGVVVVTDTWPIGLDDPVSLPGGCLYAARQVTCTLPSIPAAGSATVDLAARTNGLAGTTLANTATADGVTADPTEPNAATLTLNRI